MMSDATDDGAKTFGGIVAVLAIIGTSAGILAAICGPMLQRMSQVEKAQEKEITRWLDKADKFDVWIGEHDRRIEARDASQWERIKSLERDVFGKSSPVTIAPGDEP